MAKKSLPPLSAAEQALMDILWKKHPALMLARLFQLVVACVVCALIGPMVVASLGIATATAAAQEPADAGRTKTVNAVHKLPVTVLFHCKLIQADRHFGAHDSVLSEAEMQALVRSVSQKKGIALMSSPSVTSKLDQRATVEVVREVLPKVRANGELSGATKRSGLSVSLRASFPVNGKSTIETKVDLNVDPDSDSPWLPKMGETVDWDKIRLHTVASAAALASGETHLLHLQTSKRPVTVLITAKAIKPDGTEAKNFADTFKPEWAGSERVPATANVAGKRKIVLTVHAVEANQAAGRLLGDWSPLKRTWQRDPNTKVPIDQAPPEVRNQFTLTGILTNPQFQEMNRELGKNAGVKWIALPAATTSGSNEVAFDLPAEVGGRKLKITPKIGADGHTIDLLLEAPSLHPEINAGMSTTVKIWDGQAVLLGGEPAGKEDVIRLFFVSTWLTDEKEKDF